MEISNLPPSGPTLQNIQENNQAETPAPKEGVIQGELIETNEQTITLKLPDGAVITGELKGYVNMALLQHGIFKIHTDTTGKLHLELLDLLSGLPENTKNEEALLAAGLKITQENKTLLESLLSRQLSIDKQTIMQFKQLVNRFEGNMEKALLLLENEVLPTSRHIELTNKFFSGDLSLSEQLNNLTDTVLHTNDTTLLTAWGDILFNNEPQAMQEFLSDITTLQSDGSGFQTNLKPELEMLFAQKTPQGLGWPQLLEKETGLPLPEIRPENITHGTLEKIARNFPDGEAQLTALPPSEKETAEFLQSVKTFFMPPHDKTEIMQTIQNRIKEKLFFNPKENESLEEFIKNAEEKINQLAKTAESAADKHTPLIKAFDTIKQYNEFQQLLKDTHYVQIPLFTQDKTRDGELYIFKNKKNKHSGHKISCLLSLELAGLGLLESYIQKEKDLVSIQFRTETETQQIIKENLPLLQKMLAEKNIKLSGYSFKLLDEPFQLSQKEPKDENIRPIALSAFDTSI